MELDMVHCLTIEQDITDRNKIDAYGVDIVDAVKGEFNSKEPTRNRGHIKKIRKI